MKKLNTLTAAALCLCSLCALCAAPVYALEYTISAPGYPEYGKPTSFEPVAAADGGAMKNEDLSKTAALIPPGFGTPTSYLPGSGVYLTPNLAASQMASAGMVNGSAASVIPPASGAVSGFATGSYPTADNFSGYPTVDTGTSGTGGLSIAFTEVTSSMYYSDGSLGVLKIPSIGLTVSVYEGTGDAPLLKGAGHFTGTTAWDGNYCVAGHNRGVRNDFGKIHTLGSGNIITLTTVMGTRTYAVTGVNKVSVNDVSGLDPSAANMITLYTCVEDQPAYRWQVTAAELYTV